MGATLADGKWNYNGAPVIIIIIIRTEDERKQIGDYVATQLEAVGFTVDRQYKTRTEASPIWVQSNPTEGLYNYYTGGWITTAIDRDQADNFSFYSTPNDYPIPLFQAYTPSPEYAEVTLNLRNNDFTTLEERDELFQKAMNLSIEDSGSGSSAFGSTRIFLRPQTSDVRSRLTWPAASPAPACGRNGPLQRPGRRRDAHRTARCPGRSVEPDRWLELDLRPDGPPRHHGLGRR